MPFVLFVVTKLKVVAILLRASRSSKDIAERERGHRGGIATPSEAFYSHAFCFVCCNKTESSCNIIARFAVKKEKCRRAWARPPRRADARPQRSRTQSVFHFNLKVRFLLKKAEKPFAFSPTTCKLCFGIAFLTNRNPVSSSLHPYFNQKYTKTDQVCN